MLSCPRFVLLPNKMEEPALVFPGLPRASSPWGVCKHSQEPACSQIHTRTSLQHARSSYSDLPPKRPCVSFPSPISPNPLGSFCSRNSAPTHAHAPHPTQVPFQTRISAVLTLSPAAPGPAWELTGTVVLFTPGSWLGCHSCWQVTL